MTLDMCTLQANKTTLMDETDFVCVVRVNKVTCLRQQQSPLVQTPYLCKFANTGEKSYQLVKASSHLHHLFTVTTSSPAQPHLDLDLRLILVQCN